MIKKTIVSVAIAFTAISLCLHADGLDANSVNPQAGSGLSLAQSIEIALASNRQVLIANEGMNYADEKLNEASARRYPTLSTTASYTRLDGVASIAMPSGPKTTTVYQMGDANNSKAELSIKQPLYSGGRIGAGVESALLGRTVQSNQKNDVSKRVIFQVKKSYYDVLLNEAIVNVNRKSESVSKAHLEDIQKLTSQGQSSKYELLRAKVQLTNIQSMRLQSETTLQSARFIFVNLLGLPLEKADSLTLSDKFNSPTPDGDNLEYVAKLEDAFNNRSDLKMAQLKIDMQKQSILLAEAEGKPSLNLTGNFGYEYPSKKEFLTQEAGHYWNTGAMFTFSVFEWGRIKARIRQEESLLKQAEITELDVRERIKLEVKQTVLLARDARVLVETQQENIKQAEEGLRLAEVGYKNGVNTQLEMLDTEMGLDTASKNYVQSLYQYNLAKANLDLVTGR